MQPVEQLPKAEEPMPEEPIPPMITLARQTYERDLPEMLKTHYMKWVAYHGDKRIGFGRTQTALYVQCLKMGLQEDEFIVRSVEPLLKLDEIEFSSDI